MTKPFTTLEEIRAYVSGERITCLVCGKQFARLVSAHLQTHNMSADDYRAEFGIPWNTSLTSAPSREASGKHMTPERIDEFKLVPRVRGTSRRPLAPAVRMKWNENAVHGRYLATEMVTIGCAKCGVPVETTALCSAQPIHCVNCASPESLRQRKQWRKKAA